MKLNRFTAFIARGGGWVLAQIPILLLAVSLPMATANGGLRPQHSLQWLGIGLSVLGAGLILAGFFALGSAFTPLPQPRDGATLKSDGVYAYLSHPIYAGLIAGSIGWSLWWGSAWGLAYCVVVALFFDRKVVHEEQRLRDRFPGYAAYARRVRRFIPRVY